MRWFNRFRIAAGLTVGLFAFSAVARDGFIGRIPRDAPVEIVRALDDAQTFGDRESVIHRFVAEGRSPEFLDLALVRLASEYERSNRLQEAIWTLRRTTTRHDLAHPLLKDLEQFLVQANPVRGEVIYTGVTHPEMLDLGHGVIGIFKTQGYRAEIFSYRLSEALGMGIVPTTVPFVWQGKAGSLQVVIPDAMPGGSLPGAWQNFYRRGYPVEFKDFYLLDRLMVNNDRHERNWMWRAGGHPFPIDAGSSFEQKDFHRPRDVPALLPEGERLDRLRSLNVDALTSVLLSDDRDQFVDAHRRLLASVDAAPEKTPPIWKMPGPMPHTMIEGALQIPEPVSDWTIRDWRRLVQSFAPASPRCEREAATEILIKRLHESARIPEAARFDDFDSVVHQFRLLGAEGERSLLELRDQLSPDVRTHVFAAMIGREWPIDQVRIWRRQLADSARTAACQSLLAQSGLNPLRTPEALPEAP